MASRTKNFSWLVILVSEPSNFWEMIFSHSHLDILGYGSLQFSESLPVSCLSEANSHTVYRSDQQSIFHIVPRLPHWPIHSSHSSHSSQLRNDDAFKVVCCTSSLVTWTWSISRLRHCLAGSSSTAISSIALGCGCDPPGIDDLMFHHTGSKSQTSPS